VCFVHSFIFCAGCVLHFPAIPPPFPLSGVCVCASGGAVYQFVCLVYVSESCVHSVTAMLVSLMCLQLQKFHTHTACEKEQITSCFYVPECFVFFGTHEHDTPYWPLRLAEFCQWSFAERNRARFRAKIRGQ
jgi:hypothetical protein